MPLEWLRVAIAFIAMRVRTGNSLIELWTPAKVNLYLRILAKRSDGFHELETLIAPVTLYDYLRLAPSKQDEVRLLGATPGILNEEDHRIISTWNLNNLIVRAVELVRAQTKVSHPVRVELLKRIPPRAGLGGGSSNAAGVLLGLNCLWQLGISREELACWAAQLGSDVPAFLFPGWKVCSGRGEQVQVIEPMPRAFGVIAFPGQGLSTAEVYRHWKQPEQEVGHRVWDAVRAWQGGHRRGSPRCFNSLESAAWQLWPQLRHWCSQLGRWGKEARQLCGSGSAYFLLCHHLRQAQQVAKALVHKGWKGAWAVCTTV